MPYAYRGTTLFGSFRTLLSNPVTKVTRQNKEKKIIFTPLLYHSQASSKSHWTALHHPAALFTE